MQTKENNKTALLFENRFELYKSFRILLSAFILSGLVSSCIFPDLSFPSSGASYCPYEPDPVPEYVAPIDQISNNVYVSKEFLWRTTFTDDLAGASTLPVVYNGGVLLHNYNGINYKSTLHMIDVHTGVEKWRYTNETSHGTEILYIHDDMALVWDHNRKYTLLDLNTGEVEWEKHDLLGDHLVDLNNRVRGLDDIFVFPNVSERFINQNREYFYKGDASYSIGDLRTGNINKIHTLPHLTDRLTNFPPFRDTNGDLLLAFMYAVPSSQEPYNTEDDLDGYIGLYNITKQTLLYENKISQSPESEWYLSDIGNKTTMLGDQIINDNGGRIVSRGVYDGKTQWSLELNYSSKLLDISIHKNKLYLTQTLGESVYVQCVDPKSGGTMWENKVDTEDYTNIGRSTTQFLNGVLYGVAGVNLFAFDTETGEKYWDIKPPSFNRYDYKEYFFRFLSNIIPVESTSQSSAKLIVQTSDGAVCYEAVK